MTNALNQRHRRKGDSEKQITDISKSWPLGGQENEKRRALMTQSMRAFAIFNVAGRLIEGNNAFDQLLDLPTALSQPGTHFEAILDHQVEMGNFHGKSPNQFISSHLNLSRSPTPQSCIERRPNGRGLIIGYIPLNNGGWILTLDDISMLFDFKDEMEHTSLYDRRTALPNQNMLMNALETAFARQCSNENFALMAIDFSTSDGLLTHLCNRELHFQVAGRLMKSIRRFDVAAKLEGSRFAILQGDVSNMEQVQALAKRLGKTLSTPFDIHGKAFCAEFHMGVVLGDPKHTEETMLTQALQTAEIAKKRELDRVLVNAEIAV